MSKLNFNLKAESYRARSEVSIKRGIDSTELSFGYVEVLQDALDNEFVGGMVCDGCGQRIGLSDGERQGFTPFVVARAFGLEIDDSETFGTPVVVCDGCARKGYLSPVDL